MFFTRIKLFVFLLYCLYSVNTLFSQDIFKNGFTAKLGIVVPTTEFGDLYMYDEDYPEDRYSLKEGDVGIAAQIGYKYFFNWLNIGERMKFGIDVSWMTFNLLHTTREYSVKRKVGNDTIAYYSGEFELSHLILAPEVGPSFSFSFSEKSAIDLAVKVSPTLSFFGGSYIVPGTGDEESISGSGLGIRYTPSFSFRFSKFIFTFEYSTGEVKGSYTITDRQPYSGQSSVIIVNGVRRGIYQQTKMPSSFYRILIGIKL